MSDEVLDLSGSPAPAKGDATFVEDVDSDLEDVDLEHSVVEKLILATSSSSAKAKRTSKARQESSSPTDELRSVRASLTTHCESSLARCAVVTNIAMCEYCVLPYISRAVRSCACTEACRETVCACWFHAPLSIDLAG